MQTKSVALGEIYGVMKEMLDNGGKVNFNPRGTSMLPTLHNDGDRVVLKKLDKIKKYDLPLYMRCDGQFVLHRIVGINADGTYNMCGDNQWQVEHNVRSQQIIGTVVEIQRKGKTFSTSNPLYAFYVRIWVAIRPLRRIIIGGGRKIKNHLIRKDH